MAADENDHAGPRPLTPDDLQRREELGHVALSPDGRWLAYVVRRARATANFHMAEFMSGDDRGDVWIVATAGGAPRNLTHGEPDRAGYWAPLWSPGGDRLAMLSTKGGNVRPWVCDVESGSLRLLCERGVDLHSHALPMGWMSDHELIVCTLPEGERPSRIAAESQAAEVAMRVWPKAWEGVEPTSSVLDSGIPTVLEERPQGALLLVDVVSGHRRTLIEGFFRELRVGPGGRHAAFVRVVRIRPPEAGRTLERPRAEVGQLGIVSADGVVTAGVPDIEQPHGTSIRWSSDGGEVALIGHDGPSPDAPRLVHRYRLADGRVRAVTDAGMAPGSIAWTGDSSLLVFGARAKNASDPSDPADERPGWWLFADEREPCRIAADGCPVPWEHLIPEPGRRSFVGLADGDVVRLELDARRWTNLTAGRDLTIVWLLWPRRMGDDATFAQLLLAADGATGRAWHSLDLSSGELAALPTPSTGGWIADFAPEHGIALPVAVDRTGTRMWLSRPALGQHAAVVETNTWLAQVAEGEVRRVDYHALGGRQLQAWLILPVGYEPGTRCPLVTEVYPGHVVSGDAPPMMTLSVTGHHVLNSQLLAARGYAVLIPSMPLGPDDQPSEPSRALAEGVLPAIDKLVEAGIADPDRLGVMGHSFGGYATYGLIAQTHRFRAAVALAGLADLVSLHGQFDARHRYDTYGHEHCAPMFLTESRPLRMDVPPWRDADRYVRNSPLFDTDRVQTPLLIIQGDMDYVPLQQGEQFFGALYREGKRARFVRYWGEGHIFQSPANIRDMWEQLYGWFDEFLKPAAGSDEPAG